MKITEVNNFDTDVISYFGNWMVSNTSASHNSKPYHTTVTAGDYMTFNFTGASAVAIRGSKTPDHQRYSAVSNSILLFVQGS